MSDKGSGLRTAPCGTPASRVNGGEFAVEKATDNISDGEW
jgi:hypothetical protein